MPSNDIIDEQEKQIMITEILIIGRILEPKLFLHTKETLENLQPFILKTVYNTWRTRLDEREKISL